MFFFLTGIKFKISGGVTSVTVVASSNEIEEKQLRAEEQ